jgi:hypothetical protein
VVDDTIYRIDYRTYAHDLYPATREDLTQGTVEKLA